MYKFKSLNNHIAFNPFEINLDANAKDNFFAINDLTNTSAIQKLALAVAVEQRDHKSDFALANRALVQCLMQHKEASDLLSKCNADLSVLMRSESIYSVDVIISLIQLIDAICTNDIERLRRNHARFFRDLFSDYSLANLDCEIKARDIRVQLYERNKYCSIELFMMLLDFLNCVKVKFCRNNRVKTLTIKSDNVFIQKLQAMFC